MAVPAPLAVEALALLAQARLPRGEGRLPVLEHLLACLDAFLDRGLARSDGLGALLQLRALPFELGAGALERDLALRDRLLPPERGGVELAQCVLAREEPRLLLLTRRVEGVALALQLALAFADRGELLGDVRCC